jgi:zinc/manganese transport system substrate-binding protein
MRSELARRLGFVLALLSLASPALAADKLPVVASFSILGDLVAQVGGERVEVSTLVGPEADAHVFQPAPQDAKRVADAKLVVINGLGFEGWMDRLVAASGTKPRLVIASRGVQPIRGEGSALDPHAWQDIANTKLYVATIRDALSAVDPEGRLYYERHAIDYLKALDALDSELRARLAAIPPERRKVVTTHDAFGYFARAYGVQMIAPQGISTETEPSARDVARIIRQVKSAAIPAVFIENLSDPRLMQQIARESGAKIGGRLYPDALSRRDGPAGTYIQMMQNNIRELEAALAP